MIIFFSITGRDSSRQKLCHVQELPHWWEQRDDCLWHDEHCRFLHFMLPNHRYIHPMKSEPPKFNFLASKLLCTLNPHYISISLWHGLVHFYRNSENPLFRPVFQIRGELQRRLQDCSVQHSDGSCGDVHTIVLNTLVPLHSPCGPLLNNHRGNAWPDRLRSRYPSLEGR